MESYLETVVFVAVIGAVVVFLVIKEVAAYRLPASHGLNRVLNPPLGSRKGSYTDNSGGWDSGSDGGWDSGCDGGD
jgi:hypothetical protein